MTTVTATTVTYHDSAANSHKFYRTYVVDDIAIFQWGRIGASGQWSAGTYGGMLGADNAARSKINEKINGGYGDRTTVTFDYRGRLDPNDKDTLKPLHDLVLTQAAARPARPAPAPAPPSPVPAALDRHGEFTARALAAVTLAVTDPNAAMVELALLREQWEELQEIHERAESYLQTLNSMLLAPASA